MKRILACFAILALLSGCSTAPKDPPPSSIRAIDAAVINMVKMNLKTDPVLASCQIDVKGENGLLVLRGDVPTQEAREKAEEIALKSAKVEKVGNHLEVK